MRSAVTRSALFFAMTANAVPAFAHRPRPVCEMVVQLDGQGVAALWRVEVSGREAELLTALHDVDRNGRLGESEARAAAAAVFSKTLGRVELRWNNAPLAFVHFEARLEQAGQALAAVGLAELSRPAPDASGTLSVLVQGGECALDVHALAPWALVRANRGALAPDRRGLVQPLWVAAGERVELRAQRVLP